jgi:hypothetical protein
MEEGGARVVAEANGVPAVDVVDPTTKGYSVIASAVVSWAADTTAD